MNRYTGRGGVALLAVGLIGAAAGCGGSDESSATAGTTGGKEGATFTGKPIVVSTAAPATQSPMGTFPGLFAAVKAAAAAINAEGGINGHEVKVKACDTQASPNLEVSCARQAASDDTVTMVGSLISQNAGGYESTLANAGVADLAANAYTPQSFQGDNVFPIDFNPGTLAACGSADLAKRLGTDTLTMTAGSENAVKDQYAVLQAAAKAEGLAVAEPQLIPATTADFAPVIQKLTDSGAGLDVSVDGGPVTAGLVSGAASVAANLGFCSITSALPPDQLAKLGSAADNYYAGATLPPLSAAGKYPLLEQFKKEMDAAAAAGDDDAKIEGDNVQAQVLLAWLGMQAFRQVASAMSGDVTRETFHDALSKSTVDLGNVLGKVDFTKPQVVGPYQRVFNPNASVQKWDVDHQTFVETGISVDAAKLLGAGGSPPGQDGPPLAKNPQ